MMRDADFTFSVWGHIRWSILAVALFLAGIGCATSSTSSEPESEPPQQRQQTTPSANHPNLNATLWVQSAAEYRGLTVSVWRQALLRVDRALENESWTAALEQKSDEGIEELPPAVIVDVDETILDNSVFQARLVKQNEQFTVDKWREWCREAKAPPVPGALGFAKYAASKGVTVFYVTNRGHQVEAATRKNLKKHGFPLAEDRDVILTQGERENWTSDKTTRRDFIAESHRILLLAGDNLGDFMGETEVSSDQRISMAKDHAEKWGDKWFVLPNPMYGDWEAASYDYNFDLPIGERRQRKLERLNTMSGNDDEEQADD